MLYVYLYFMQVLIIEDEIKTAKALSRIIASIEPDADIVTCLQTVQSAVDFFNKGMFVDIAFMDVQLADGLSFDIFKETKVHCPVIFCTAYDEYAIEGFKANGIDYILKPFAEGSIKTALGKFHSLRNFFQANSQNAQHIIQSFGTSGKQNFLVFHRNRYLVVPVDKIAYFYIKYDATLIHTFEGKEYVLNQSLEIINGQLPNGTFYRLNRQYLINFDAIKDVEPFFSRKLMIHLKVNTFENLIINKNKTTEFLSWLDSR